MTDIAAFRRSHREAVARALAAGYDIVYVYAAHDRALPLHFLSRRHNRRSDAYGGSVDNRMRLLRELIEDTLDVCAGRAAVAVRFAVHDFGGGIDRDEEGRAVLEALGELPDLWDVNVSPWAHDSSTARFDDEGWQEPWVAFVKSLTTKPVVGVGRFTSADAMVVAGAAQGARLHRRGAALDRRSFPAREDPQRAQRRDPRVHRLQCLRLDRDVRRADPLHAERDHRRGVAQGLASGAASRGTASARSALVVGAGPAGLEAALTLARRGLEVSLVEAAASSAGGCNGRAGCPARGLSSACASTAAISSSAWPTCDLPRLAAGADDVIEFGAQRVVLATGAHWRSDGVGPSTPDGHRRPRVVDPILHSPEAGRGDACCRASAGRGPAVVYDDDHYYVGHSVAELLRAQGLEVTLVTPLAEVSQWSYYTLELRRLEERLARAGIRCLTRTHRRRRAGPPRRAGRCARSALDRRRLLRAGHLAPPQRRVGAGTVGARVRVAHRRHPLDRDDRRRAGAGHRRRRRVRGGPCRARASAPSVPGTSCGRLSSSRVTS